jgi:hypothetical protein
MIIFCFSAYLLMVTMMIHNHREFILFRVAIFFIFVVNLRRVYIIVIIKTFLDLVVMIIYKLIFLSDFNANHIILILVYFFETF